MLVKKTRSFLRAKKEKNEKKRSPPLPPYNLERHSSHTGHSQTPLFFLANQTQRIILQRPYTKISFVGRENVKEVLLHLMNKTQKW